VDAQDIVANNVPHVDGRHLQARRSTRRKHSSRIVSIKVVDVSAAWSL
jgi:hypothetical protein